ncbi:TetR/AcrR family transcriptional regulator [Actinoallomurus iriomotensis]|jgi:AcrR family transcriptional regulator|uniref:TetR family transcriptional regulator n=1 Tax=Actinoallomurus iriomotensis TaxID=478107 RepID=A0A9W6W4J3_9ACTN|nr:TetR/AcrR family transcriptional regulator [Actinoallomurus iriomotensis]GLY72346.1 TetR family transcriptional regulator [Actinoallomurus iriomotensis]GLY90007.1 TetR family transcriptional regulator [Actinoallomurus iriomotensis]
MREQSQQRILEAALMAFAERGYEGTTIAQIAERAGVARGLVSYYFPAKEQLLQALLGQALDAILALTDPAEGEDTPDLRLAGIIDRTLESAANTIGVQRLVLCLMLQPGTREIFVGVEAAKADAVEEFERRLQEIFAARGAEDPALEEVLFRSVLEGVIFKVAVYPETYPLAAVRHRLLTMYGLPAGDPPDEPVRPLRAT